MSAGASSRFRTGTRSRAAPASKAASSTRPALRCTPTAWRGAATRSAGAKLLGPGLWNSLAIRTDLDGTLIWQRADQYREAGDPGIDDSFLGGDDERERVGGRAGRRRARLHQRRGERLRRAEGGRQRRRGVVAVAIAAAALAVAAAAASGRRSEPAAVAAAALALALAAAAAAASSCGCHRRRRHRRRRRSRPRPRRRPSTRLRRVGGGRPRRRRVARGDRGSDREVPPLVALNVVCICCCCKQNKTQASAV